MDEHTTTTPARKKPGAVFFMAAMLVYLFGVHGLSLLTADWAVSIRPLAGHAGIPPRTGALIEGVLDLAGQSRAAFCAAALTMLFACMLCIFHITRRVAKGPIWLGSLAAVVFMAHPVKTEVFFTASGFYYLVSALAALLSVLAYLRLAEAPGAARFAVALLLFAVASFPFPVNAALLGVLVLLEYYPGKPETRQWGRLLPFLGVTIVANWIHLDMLYARLPNPAENLGPLLLVIYPIGLLPATVWHLNDAPLAAWMWGAAAFALFVALFALVKNGAFRVALLAILAFRFYPGVEAIDLNTMSGGSQLLFPLALSCIALAGFTGWLLRFEAWGKPAIALTTMLCVVLFVLQFQANRSHARGDSVSVEVAPKSAEADPEGPPRG